MSNSKGYRSGTRNKFRKAFGQHGSIRLKNYLRKFHTGDYVDIVVDGAIHKGMPHHQYHGQTARVFNVNPRSVGVLIHKTVRTRKIEKRLHIRPEHLRLSSCRKDFLERCKQNAQIKAEAKKTGAVVCTKRQPKLPTTAHVVKVDMNKLEGRNIKPHIKIY